eukprot:2667906-Prymnesium_polylepis.1
MVRYGKTPQGMVVRARGQSHLRVAHDERRLQPALGGLDALDPRNVPERLKLNDRPRNLVVDLDALAAILRVGQLVHISEVVHWPLDAAHQLARPHDVACDGGRVAHVRRARLELFVGAHDCLQVGVVVLEDGCHLGVE